jgi:hypothetical protein
MLKRVHQALGVLMQRMSYHVVDFGREPLPPDAVVAGPPKRPDETGFEEDFDIIEFLLVFRSQLFVRDRVSLRHPDEGS